MGKAQPKRDVTEQLLWKQKALRGRGGESLKVRADPGRSCSWEGAEEHLALPPSPFRGWERSPAEAQQTPG